MMTVPAIRTEAAFDRVTFARRVLEAEGASLLLVAACTSALAEARRRGGNTVALATIRFDAL